ncbi:MAG: hypothetical protein SOZ62_00985 [Eubacteriales bacterium]|nr:hypothetical protein [Eubacteriales bacterium]
MKNFNARLMALSFLFILLALCILIILTQKESEAVLPDKTANTEAFRYSKSPVEYTLF